MAKQEVVRKSSGNVFADLEVPEAGSALAKAELAARVCTIISRKKLTQAQAAKLLGVDQPKISALMRGHLSGFSLDRLFRFLNALGRDVEIVVRPKRRSKKPTGIRVVGEPVASS